jgi:hypothetical protein
MGPDQCHTEERRVPPGIHSSFLQQKERHSGGRQQIHHHVLQVGTQGLILDSQAHHEEPWDVRGDTRHRQQVRPSRVGDPRQQTPIEIPRRTRSRVSRINPTPLRIMIGRGSRTSPWPTWTGRVATRSIGPDRESLKVSWTGSASSTPRGSI